VLKNEIKNISQVIEDEIENTLAFNKCLKFMTITVNVVLNIRSSELEFETGSPLRNTAMISRIKY
jgi:hypothetical protein